MLDKYTVYSHGSKTRLSLAIPYDEQAVAAIKALPGAKYYREARRWYVDYSPEARATLKQVSADTLRREFDRLPGPGSIRSDVQEHADEIAINGGR